MPAVLPFVAAAVERDEPVLVAVLTAREQALRDQLGSASDRVEFVDMQSAGRNPARIIPVWNDFVARHAAQRQGAERRRGADLGGADAAGDRRVPAPRVAAQPGLRGRRPVRADLPVRRGRPAGRCPRGGAREPSPRRRGRHGGRPAPATTALDAIGASDRRPLPPRARAPAGATRSAPTTSRAVRHEVAAWAIAPGRRRARGLPTWRWPCTRPPSTASATAAGAACCRSWTDDDAVVCEIADAGALRDPARRPLAAGARLASAAAASGSSTTSATSFRSARRRPGTVIRMHQRIGRRRVTEPHRLGRPRRRSSRSACPTPETDRSVVAVSGELDIASCAPAAERRRRARAAPHERHRHRPVRAHVHRLERDQRAQNGASAPRTREASARSSPRPASACSRCSSSCGSATSSRSSTRFRLPSSGSTRTCPPERPGS